MSAGDVLVIAGPAVLPASLALAGCGIILVPRPRWVTALALVLAAAMVVSFVVVFLTWGWGFDYADANRPVPESLDRAMVVAGLVFAAAYVLFVATSLLTALSALRRRRGSTGQRQVLQPSR